MTVAPAGWEQVAKAVLDSLSQHEISAQLAIDWLRMITTAAEQREKP